MIVISTKNEKGDIFLLDKKIKYKINSILAKSGSRRRIIT